MRRFNYLLWLSDPQWSAEVFAGSPATTLFRDDQIAAAKSGVESGVSASAARQYAKQTATALSRGQFLASLRLPGRDEYLACARRRRAIGRSWATDAERRAEKGFGQVARNQQAVWRGEAKGRLHAQFGLGVGWDKLAKRRRPTKTECEVRTWWARASQARWSHPTTILAPPPAGSWAARPKTSARRVSFARGMIEDHDDAPVAAGADQAAETLLELQDRFGQLIVAKRTK